MIEYANYLAEKGHNVVLWYNICDTVFKLHPKLKLLKIPILKKLGTIIYATINRFNSDVVIVDIIVEILDNPVWQVVGPGFVGRDGVYFDSVGIH